MIDALEICRQAQNVGIKLEVDGCDLLVSPTSKCPTGFIDKVREHKAELLAYISSGRGLGWGSVPPSDLPLDPAMPRPSPDARERVIGYLLHQGCHRPGPLTEWLVRRETAYFDGLGRQWDCALFSYCAARDCLMWQLGTAEAGVLLHLKGGAAAGTVGATQSDALPP